MQFKNRIENKNLGTIGYPVGEDFAGARKLAKEMAKELGKLYRTDPIYIWCRGSSGAIIASIIGDQLGTVQKIYHVKKEGETSHSSYHSTSPDVFASPNRHIIVDDFMATGETIRHIWNEF